MISQKGFTLIESLAAGIVSTIVAGAMLSFMAMANRQIKEMSANLRLDEMQTVVSEVIRNDARRAFGSKTEDDVANAAFGSPIGYLAVHGRKEILFCGNNGVPFSRYQIATEDGKTVLKQWKDDLEGYTPFMVGDQKVLLDAAASNFGILEGRLGVTFELACLIHADKDYIFPAKKETALHRGK